MRVGPPVNSTVRFCAIFWAGIMSLQQCSSAPTHRHRDFQRLKMGTGRIQYQGLTAWKIALRVCAGFARFVFMCFWCVCRYRPWARLYRHDWHSVNGNVWGIADRRFFMPRTGWNPAGAAPEEDDFQEYPELEILGGFRFEGDICLSWTFSVTQSRAIQAWQPSRTPVLVPVAEDQLE